MRAYSIETFGLDKLAVITRPPAPLGPHSVRVRVRAVSLNYRDLMTVEGTYNPRQKLPLVPCSDAAGEVVELGSAVTRFAVGARVMTLFAQRWLAGRPTVDKLKSTLGGPADGVLAEEIVLSEEGLVAVPEALSFADASTLPCAGLTAWSALQQAGVTSGDTVVVQGTGGVSVFALQLAKLRGARVVVTSKSDEKLERARSLGADHGINYQATPEWGKAALAFAGGDGVDCVIEVGGAGTLAQSLRAVRPGGTVAIIGVLAGGASELALTSLLMRNVRLQGVMVGHREALEDLTRAIVRGGVRPVVGERVRFDEAPAAFARMKAGAHFGKIVVEVGDR